MASFHWLHFIYNYNNWWGISGVLVPWNAEYNARKQAAMQQIHAQYQPYNARKQAAMEHIHEQY